jgi:anti-anti-sigma factor
MCGKELVVGPLQLPGEAACPHCGQVLWFDKRTVGGVLVLDVICGKVAINQSIPQIAGLLIRQDDSPRVVLNLSDISFVSSSFIAGLVALNKRVATAKGRFVLCELTPVVHETLRGAKLDRLLEIAATEQEALARFSSSELGPQPAS